ncbi:DNA-binding protein HU [Neisseriaceae bacterium PsAf]|nr:DNA-binding protein HU [Neisseriaceae bacterium PsAf]MCV2502940.1 HU family DNA-binding protein [Neisseriaceae bacterium]
MNRSELVSAIAESAGIPKNTAAKALDGFIDSVSGALGKGDTVTLVGFGTFYVGERAERNGRNPKTGETIVIKASKTPKFRAGKNLKESV